MSTVALSGNDSVVLNNQILADFADTSVAELTFPNEIASVKVGKNGNAIYALNETGRVGELKLRIIRGSADDKFLNNLLSQQQANFAGAVLLIGEFVKKVGDGTGKVTFDTYIASGGIFTKCIEAKSNVEGDTEQSVAIYSIKFSKAVRVLT